MSQEEKEVNNLAQEGFLALSCEELEEKRDLHKDRGEYEECIMTMERIIVLKKQSFGGESSEFIRGVNELSQLLNMVGMIQLEKGNLDFSLQVLKKAEMLMSASLQMRAVTSNNMACYYRHTGKIRTALNYLQNALAMESQLNAKDIYLGDTHLNLSAVLSQLGRHQLALEHAMMALICLQDELLAVAMEPIRIQQGQKQQESENKRILESKKINVQSQKKGNATSTTAQSIRKERIAMLCIAFHNLGVEFEHLKREEEALKYYKKAHQMAVDYLGESHAVVKKLERVLQNINSQQAQKEEGSMKRQLNPTMQHNKNNAEKDNAKRMVLNKSNITNRVITPSQSVSTQKNGSHQHQIQKQCCVAGKVKDFRNPQDNKTKEQLQRQENNNNKPSMTLKGNKENRPPRSSASSSISAVTTPRQSCESLLAGSVRENRRYAPQSRSFSIDCQSSISDHSLNNSNTQNKLSEFNYRQSALSRNSEYLPEVHPLSARSNPMRQPISARFSRSRDPEKSCKNTELPNSVSVAQDSRTASSLSNIFVPQQLNQLHCLSPIERINNQTD